MAGVSPLLDVASLPESSFPQARSCCPRKEFFDEVMVALRLSLRPPPPLRVQSGFVSGDGARQRSMAPSSHVRRHRPGTGSSSQPVGGSDGVVVPSGRSAGPAAPSTALPLEPGWLLLTMSLGSA